MNVEYTYIDPKNPPIEYVEMLKNWYGIEKWARFKKYQFEWYQKYEDYKVFTAKDGNRFIGQASAFKVPVAVDNHEVELWWGVDTFLFKEYRGKGVGKYLQLQLHKDCPNFSSAAYTPKNAIVKRKCGGKDWFQKNIYYYPVSSYLQLLISICLKKTFALDIPFKFVPFSVYTHKSPAVVKHFEVEKSPINEEIVRFMNSSLRRKYDFFVKKNLDYLKWKYQDNPAFSYTFITFRKAGEIKAVVGFTDVRKYSIGGKFVRGIKILDSITSPDNILSDTNLLCYVMQYCKKNNMNIDGVFSLTKCNCYPYIHIAKPVLSTCLYDVQAPYLTFLDQDMEQEM